jgi:DNA-binding transcriptional regulator YdaS (Cro superfamily)
VSTSVNVLKAAADIVGGSKELAERLGIGERLLVRFMEGRRAVPDGVLLRAVDIVLQERQARTSKLEVRDALLREGRQ